MYLTAKVFCFLELYSRPLRKMFFLKYLVGFVIIDYFLGGDKFYPFGILNMFYIFESYIWSPKEYCLFPFLQIMFWNDIHCK